MQKSPGLARWVVVATAIHLGLCGLFELVRGRPVVGSPTAPLSANDLEIELLDPVVESRPTPTDGPESGDHSGSSASGVVSRPGQIRPHSGRSPAPGVTAATEGPGPQQAVATGTAAGTIDNSATSQESESPTAQASDAPTAAPAPATLSLDQLGLNGGVRDQTLLRKTAPVPRARQAERRLAQSMAEEVAHRDLQLGLGPEGPILRQLEVAVRKILNTPDEGSALFSVRLDEVGRVTHLEVLEANGAFGAWEAAGRAAAAALSDVKRRLPDGAKGMDLQIRVDSRIQMPSGAAPGLDVSVGGIRVSKKRKTSRPAAKIGILEPVIKFEAPDFTDEAGRLIPTKPALRVGMNILSLPIDPADIGARAQRIVRARVVTQTPL